MLSWTTGKQRHRQERAEAERGGRVWQAELEQRLDAAHEEWRQRQKHMQQGGEHVGEAQASRRFWQAARDSGINLMDHGCARLGRPLPGERRAARGWRHDPVVAEAARMGRRLDRVAR